MKKILLPHQLYYPYVDTHLDRSTQEKETKFIESLDQKKENKKGMIYIHVPFCNSKCVFCGFYKLGTLDSAERYVSMLKKEIDFYSSKPYVKNMEITGIHIGGGTPTYLPLNLLGEIIDYTREKFGAADVPINIESSASTIDQKTIDFFHKYKVNRISIGVQSFDPKLREKLEIKSTLAENLKVIPWLKKENLTIYIDLLYGFPHMGLGDYQEIVKRDLEKAIELDVDGLDFSQYYPFYNALGATAQKEHLTQPSQEEVIDTLTMGSKILENAGYIQTTEYGFCKKGEIMLEKTYFGEEMADCIAMGPRALGTLNGYKYMNGTYFQETIPSYILIKKLAQSEIERAPIVTFPKLLSLDKKALSPKLSQEFKPKFDELKQDDLIKETDHSYELTPKGKSFISNIYLFLMTDEEQKTICENVGVYTLK